MGLNSDAAWSVERALQLAVSKTEVRFAWFRSAFCSLILLIFFLNNPPSLLNFGPRAVLEVGIALFGIAFSALVLRLSRVRTLRERDLRLSVSVDATICTCGLMTNTIAPSPGYAGVFGTLDVAAVLLVILGSIFRASWVAVLLAGTLNLMGLSLITWLDAGHGIEPPWGKVRLFSLYIFGAVAISLFATARVRGALSRFTETALMAERAKASVEHLLRDQHDLKSSLFDIRLNVERLAEVQDSNSPLVGDTLKKVAARLSGFSSSFEKTQFRSLSILRGLSAPEVALVDHALRQARASLPTQTSLLVDVSPIPESCPVFFGGGTEGLALLVTHLLDNAAGGDGRSGAKVVHIDVTIADTETELTLADDGPGFQTTQLGVVGVRPVSSPDKATSSGLGLWLARRAVEAAGGRIRFDNRPGGGARIRITLRRALGPSSSGTVGAA